VFISKITWMQLRTQCAAELRELAGSEELRAFGLIDARKLGVFVEDFLHGRHRDEQAIWRLLMFGQWLRLFKPAG
jgi:hypothetical protein